MEISAADLSNLQLEQSNPLANQHASGNVEGELKVLNEGLPSGKRSGDIDQTAQQLPATKKQRMEIFDQLFKELEVTKGKVENFKHDLRMAELKGEHSKKNEEYLRQQIQRDAKLKEKHESDLSSLLRSYDSVNQRVYSLHDNLLKVKDEICEVKMKAKDEICEVKMKAKDEICELRIEKAELKKMNENLMIRMTQQQPMYLDTDQVSREN